MLRERTKSGLHNARGAGRTLGRPVKLTTHQNKDLCAWSILASNPLRMLPGFLTSIPLLSHGCWGAINNA